MTAEEARTLATARRSETRLEHILRVYLYPQIVLAAGWGHYEVGLQIDSSPYSCWYMDGVSMIQSVTDRLKLEGYKVEHDWGALFTHETLKILW